jgi:DNA polymerase III subunit delta'
VISAGHMQQTIFSWQTAVWEQLSQAKQQNILPHALLFVGIDGIGKSHFANLFANLILCKKADNAAACGDCHDCHLFRAKSHPDYLWVEPEATGKIINVDQIRALIKRVNETTMQNGFRVIVINPATSMNQNAANALLKTLEEPTPNTLIILICNQGMRLPATVISRCQKVIFHKPAHSDAVNWLREKLSDDKIDPQLLLKLADGAPLKALAWLQEDLFSLRVDLYQGLHALSKGEADPLQLAAKWQDADQTCLVDLLLSWLTDLLRYKLTNDQTTLVNSDYKNEIAKVSVELLKNNLLAYMDHLQQIRQYLAASLNLNKQLLVEDLLIRWTEYVSS